MSEIIKVSNISKKYNINQQRGGYVALRDVLANVSKSPFRFAKDKAKTIIGKNKKEEFWALKDIDFTVEEGEAVGIIGANGAGKSTLLKILTRITPPTTGEIEMKGSVASLLEVGTGFHPELTGRENIFLNGAILGMRKEEIEKKFDAIVEFSGIGKFIDMPVKRYSSGMYVRLAFSIAAHLEPDILLIDEVLAVGDIEFQKKCLGKLDEVTKKAGRTILFVSHNMGAVKNLCAKTIWLKNGRIKKIGGTKEIIDSYIKNKPNDNLTASNYLQLNDGDFNGKIKFTNISITDGQNSTLINSDSNLKITIEYESDFKQKISDIRILISIFNEHSQRMVYRLDSHGAAITLKETINPSGEIICETGKINLADGKYLAEILILPQKTKNDCLKLNKEFDVVTDISKYNYRLNPDKNVCDHLISYIFRA
ncbi:hypothetical protein A2Y83_03270 [Candidatus Falkowbacteria bacterium RBG_13_39_14]|uniref:ABC transporter domain-containing protein n=1 Tax=Candidatus Falkowbacteria bacterium RBG_13_39_14 TaxID=1797985 RepID=A0A1F5S4X8_9BACT|nr:MAG: hypothetical protein A2Y83_03270 [Candidatus Falkowbacteria bacterium RBG_13_39_14]